MRIEDPDSNTVLKRIDVCLEESEAKELRDKLEILLRDSERGEKAHQHVSRRITKSRHVLMGFFASFAVAKKNLEFVSELFRFALLEAYVDPFQDRIAIWVFYSHESHS